MITIPYLTALTTYFSYGLLFAFGQFRDFFRKIFDWWKASNLQVTYALVYRQFFYYGNELEFWSVEMLGICSDLLRTWRFLHPPIVSSHSGNCSWFQNVFDTFMHNLYALCLGELIGRTNMPHWWLVFIYAYWAWFWKLPFDFFAVIIMYSLANFSCEIASISANLVIARGIWEVECFK